MYKQKTLLQILFSSEGVLVEHGETCLKINGKQSLKLKNGSIEFKNNLKQIAVSFKNYVDFICNLRGVRGSDRKNNASCTEKYQAHIPCSFPYKLFVLIINLANQFFFMEEKMQSINLLKGDV